MSRSQRITRRTALRGAAGAAAVGLVGSPRAQAAQDGQKRPLDAGGLVQETEADIAQADRAVCGQKVPRDANPK